MTTAKNEKEETVGLKRELGLFSAVSLVVAVMIGSGIFVSPATALDYSGSVGLCLIIWIVAGILSLFGALAFAELSAVVPRSGAEYAYFMDAFGPLHSYFGQLPSFICSWVIVFVLRPAEVAVVILTFAEYSVQPFSSYMPDMPIESKNQLKKLIAVLALGLLTYINLSSVKLYVKVQNLCTICKVAACFLVIGGGINWLATGHTELLENPFKNTTNSAGNIALAFYSGLWAYDGWTSATIVTEEVKKPEVNILRSILIAVPTITLLYVSMNVMYMAVLPVNEMVASKAVAVNWANIALPPWLGLAIPLGVTFSTFGCGLSLQFGVSRLCYVAGREGHVPRFFSFVHYSKMTPAAAVALQGILAFFCILVGNIEELIDFASFLTWVFYGMAMIALIIMRRTKSEVHRPYAVPIVIPWLVLLISLFLVITPIIDKPSLNFFFALIFILLGVGVYHFFVYNKMKNNFSAKLTYLVQILCLVVPPGEESEEPSLEKEVQLSLKDIDQTSL